MHPAELRDFEGSVDTESVRRARKARGRDFMAASAPRNWASAPRSAGSLNSTYALEKRLARTNVLGAIGCHREDRDFASCRGGMRSGSHGLCHSVSAAEGIENQFHAARICPACRISEACSFVPCPRQVEHRASTWPSSINYSKIHGCSPQRPRCSGTFWSLRQPYIRWS